MVRFKTALVQQYGRVKSFRKINRITPGKTKKKRKAKLTATRFKTKVL